MVDLAQAQRHESSLETAKFLLQIRAVKLNNNEPFIWASGRRSPIYCDNRITLSYPHIRTFIRQEFVKIIENKIGPVDAIAGVATGGIPQGALVAQELGLPFVYVRSEAKKHGMGNQIEGEIESGKSVVVVEDLVSTGKSSLLAVDALREHGCDVKGMVAVFTYGLGVAEKNFADARVPLYTLTNYNDLIECAVQLDMLPASDLKSLQEWRKDPEAWSDAH
ncbi:MAG: orotate phosphoribosyltransferase [Bacteroides sp.]|nr:orotate phosphoribosyltransferase [Bacteroides sp.]MCM1085887.1 orotate phosphoribosyltransferase [Bacteroides sp.]